MELTRRSVPMLSLPHARLIAVANGRLAAVHGDSALSILNLSRPDQGPICTAELGWRPDVLSLSPLGRFVLAATVWERYALFDVEAGRIVEDLTGLVTAGFLRIGGREVLMRFPRRYLLEGILLDGLSTVFSVEMFPAHVFFFSHVLAGPFDDGDTFMMLGHRKSDWDRLLTLSFRALVADPNEAERELRKRTRVADYAHRLAAGACGPHEVAIFRDPDDAEDPVEAGEEAFDIWAFQGIYIRDVRDGKLIERIDYDAAIDSATPMMGSESSIAIAVPEGVDFVRRRDPEGSIWTLEAQAVGFDFQQKQIVLVQPGGGVEKVDLP